MRHDESELLERNVKMHQQSKIGESIHNIKNSPKAINEYPYEIEKELLTKVKNGDAIGAKAILNELLGYVFFTGGGNLEIIKARSLELIQDNLMYVRIQVVFILTIGLHQSFI